MKREYPKPFATLGELGGFADIVIMVIGPIFGLLMCSKTNN